MTKSQRQHGIGSLAPGEKIVGKPGGLVAPGVTQYGFFKKAFKKIKISVEYYMIVACRLENINIFQIKVL